MRDLKQFEFVKNESLVPQVSMYISVYGSENDFFNKVHDEIVRRLRYFSSIYFSEGAFFDLWQVIYQLGKFTAGEFVRHCKQPIDLEDVICWNEKTALPERKNQRYLLNFAIGLSANNHQKDQLYKMNRSRLYTNLIVRGD